MTRSIKITLSILIFSFCFIASIDAQKKKRKTKKEDKTETSTNEIMEVNLKNGNTLVGELLKFTSDSIVIMNEQFGRMAFSKSEVKGYTGLDKIAQDEEGWNKEKYQSQYFILPNARPVGKGNRYYTNFNVFANTFSFGLSDNFSLTAGFETVSLFAGEIPVVYLNPKISIPINDKIYAGLGTTIFIVTWNDELNIGGLAYANTTIGSAIKNFSVGVGFAYTSGDVLNEPLIQLGFALPLSKKVSILAESFTSKNFEGLYNIGLRIITKGNIVFDAGITRPIGFDDVIIGFPLLSISVPF